MSSLEPSARFMVTQLALSQAATFLLLISSILALWIRPMIALGVLAGAILLGYYSGMLYGLAIAPITLLALACWGYQRQERAIRLPSAVAFLGIGLLLGLHKLPGFNNPQIADNVVLSAGAAPYDLYINFDKPLVGLLFLCFGGCALIRNRRELGVAVRIASPLAITNILVVTVAALSIGYLHFDPHWHSLFGLWAISNLFFTCVSEEVFFRGFIQQGIALFMGHTNMAQLVALLTASLLFGVAHIGGGWLYVVLASIAGLGYGYVFLRTKSIEMSILAHFLMNTVHFVLFTYPRLA